jgi:small nuclear ribonucleoprotein (snRNP)-like protein
MTPPPVSLGKPSLRYRLESYYSLVAPDAIADNDKWKQNFDIIYDKYGGTVEGETKLSNKLAKKYGSQIRLLVAPPHRQKQRELQTGSTQNVTLLNDNKHDESHYKIDENQVESRVLDFTSSRFDAQYALIAPDVVVLDANPGLNAENTRLDNISKFRAFLPECDPQRVVHTSTHKHASAPKSRESISAEALPTKKTPMFLSMSSQYGDKNSGPLSLLYSIVANRQRARVMVRYVDCIRGTLTGYLIAFDKHFNMILKDVEEIYSGRITKYPKAVEVADESDDRTVGSVASSNIDANISNNCHESHAPLKSKLEKQRRNCYPPDGSGGPGPAVKERYFHQMMVRGDNVVMVWRAEAERSTHPRTSKSPSHSLYAKSGSSGKEQQIGTPGSLYYALQRWESQHGRWAPW